MPYIDPNLIVTRQHVQQQIDPLTKARYVLNRVVDPTIIRPKVIREDAPHILPLPGSPLTDEVLAETAGRGTMIFKFNARLSNPTQTLGLDGFAGGEVVIPVEGVAGFDDLLNIISQNPYSTTKIDVGAGDPAFVDITVADILRLKAAFIAIYGNVDRPDYYIIPEGYSEDLGFPPFTPEIP